MTHILKIVFLFLITFSSTEASVGQKNLDNQMFTCKKSYTEPLLDEQVFEFVVNRIIAGDIVGIKKMIDCGLNLEGTIDERAGRTFLNVAVWNYQNDIVKLLLQNGADVNGVDGDMSTPAINAVKAGNVEALKILQEYKANLSLKNKWGETVKSVQKNIKRFATFTSNPYTIEINKHGAVLKESQNPDKTEWLYLGNKCDAFSKVHGKGTWKFDDYEKGTFTIRFNDKTTFPFDNLSDRFWKNNLPNQAQECK